MRSGPRMVMTVMLPLCFLGVVILLLPLASSVELGAFNVIIKKDVGQDQGKTRSERLKPNPCSKNEGRSLVKSLKGLIISLKGKGRPCPTLGYREPVTLSSRNGVLEVSLLARQGAASLDTVKAPVKNFLLFSYELIQGKSSDGERRGRNLYPGPTLQVFPGETLIIHIQNKLDRLTIDDFYDPAYIPTDGTVPLYPRQLPSAPFNLHTHGLHVSPKGNSDNVLLSIPPGYTNSYTYKIPEDHPQGIYWYHSHRHQVTGQETYTGLVGMLMIGRSDGNIPIVTRKHIPIRNMALQFNFVFDRAGGLSTLNNYSWPQWVSTLVEPSGDELADGTYEPKLWPTNFLQSDVGTKFAAVWYTGELSVDNNRGQFELMPGNLRSFIGSSGDSSENLPADPSLPEQLRDVQYTINGQFQPMLKAKPGQTEIWVLANVSDLAYFNIRLTETATGTHPLIPIVGVDGNPTDQVQYPIPPSDGTTLVIPPASRYAIAVTMPQEGDLVLEMAPATNQATVSDDGILYTNNGTQQSPAVLGTIEIDGSVISYYDGFFYYPTQVLARVEPKKGVGITTPFVQGQDTNAFSSFFNTQGITPDVTRTIEATGGFDNSNASMEDPKAFVYQFNGQTFGYINLFQPRLNSVEQWDFINMNNDSHPIHVHVNDYQVSEVYSPLDGVTTGFQLWGQDNADLPVPVSDSSGDVTEASRLSIRHKFQDFTGTFVMHCHRLNHEDNGMMLVVNIIPEISTYAVAEPGSAGKDATVRVYNGDQDQLLATVTPFPGFQGSLSVVMGYVDGDQVLDLIVGAGAGGPPEVVAYSGASSGGSAPFERELLRFLAFDSDFSGGVSVAAADIDGNALADNVIVGSGTGIRSIVKVYSSTLPKRLGVAPEVWSQFTPYGDSTAGIQVAAGLFDAMAGRNDIVTAPGPGVATQIRSFRYDLFIPNALVGHFRRPNPRLLAKEPRLTTDFAPFDSTYTGGVAISTGWLAGMEGGAKSLVVGQLTDSGMVKIYTTGSALLGDPTDYLMSPDAPSGMLSFTEVADFEPFGDAPGGGVRVATTTEVDGDRLLVSGLSSDGGSAIVRKYDFEVSSTNSEMLDPLLIAEVESVVGSGVPNLGGE